MAKHWRHQFLKKHGQTWEQARGYDKLVKENKKEKHYANLGVKEIPEDTYSDAIYYGLFRNNDNSLNELYAAKKGEDWYFVILGTKTSVDECPKTYVYNKDTDSKEKELLFIYNHVEYEIKAEIPRVITWSDCVYTIHDIFEDPTRSLEDKLEEVKSLTESKSLVRKK